MDTSLNQFLRLSPYHETNLLNRQPNTIISEAGNSKNLLQISHSPANINKFISYNNYQPEKQEISIE